MNISNMTSKKYYAHFETIDTKRHPALPLLIAQCVCHASPCLSPDINLVDDVI